LLGWLVLGAIGCDRAKQDGKLQIAVIPKGTSHLFWQSVKAGAEQAGNELGVDILWKGPLKENDRNEQIKIVEQFITDGVDGIVLCPMDDVALLRPVQRARDAKIPVVIADSALQGEVGKDFISFVATDNRLGGEMAGHRLVQILGGKGKVVMLRFQEGSASTQKREEGFLAVLREHPQIEVLSDNQYAGDVNQAIRKTEEMLDTLRQADGLFCPNESTTQGALVTLRRNNLAGKIEFVGFDSSPELVKAMESDEIDSLVVQNPVRIGHDGVVSVVNRLRGNTVERRVDTGVVLATRDNMTNPSVASLLGTK